MTAKMTVASIEAKVRRIRKMAGDQEAAHTDEDRLYREVLAAIAAGAENPAELAASALKTMRIRFARWCA